MATVAELVSRFHNLNNVTDLAISEYRDRMRQIRELNPEYLSQHKSGTANNSDYEDVLSNAEELLHELEHLVKGFRSSHASFARYRELLRQMSPAQLDELRTTIEDRSVDRFLAARQILQRKANRTETESIGPRAIEIRRPWTCIEYVKQFPGVELYGCSYPKHGRPQGNFKHNKCKCDARKLSMYPRSDGGGGFRCHSCGWSNKKGDIIGFRNARGTIR